MPHINALATLAVTELIVLAAILVSRATQDERVIRARRRLEELSEFIRLAKIEGSPKALKKARRLEPEFKALRSFIFRHTLIDSFKYMLLFFIGLFIITSYWPYSLSPVYIPGLTYQAENGIIIIPSAILMLLIYMLNVPWIQSAMGVRITTKGIYYTRSRERKI